MRWFVVLHPSWICLVFVCSIFTERYRKLTLYKFQIMLLTEPTDNTDIRPAVRDKIDRTIILSYNSHHSSSRYLHLRAGSAAGSVSRGPHICVHCMQLVLYVYSLSKIGTGNNFMAGIYAPSLTNTLFIAHRYSCKLSEPDGKGLATVVSKIISVYVVK